MTPQQQKVYESIPADAPRSSRLEPYRELILRWRRQGRTYRRICTLLAEQYNVKMNCGALYRYVKLRSRLRKPLPETENEQLAFTPKPVSPVASIPLNPQVTTADPYAEQRERMRQHKEAPPPVKPRKVFEVSEDDLDPTKPLRMMPPSTPKEK